MGENVIYTSGKIHGIVYEITQDENGEYAAEVFSSKSRETFRTSLRSKTRDLTEAKAACSKLIKGP